MISSGTNIGKTIGNNIIAKIVQINPIRPIINIPSPVKINNNKIPTQNMAIDAITIAHTVAVTAMAPTNSQCQPKITAKITNTAIATIAFISLPFD